MMLNLNNAQVGDAPTTTEFSLIPAGTICRAVIVVKQGDTEIPEFGRGNWFKKSANTSAKWLELEFTIIGGEFDRRKFWDKIFVDGDKLGDNGVSMAKEIGLSTLRQIIESANNIDPSDMSEAAQQRRNINGVGDLNAMEICAKVGIKKGTNGYSDQNKLTAAMTPNQNGFIGSGQAPVQQTPSASYGAPTQQTQPVQNNSAVPSWANR
jgi:hypothetical protein